MNSVHVDPVSGNEVAIPENLDDFIVHHPHNRSFFESATFVILFLSVVAVLGSSIGVILALR